MILYKTKDLNEAAFIWCLDAKLVAVEPEIKPGGNPDKPETFYFRFEVSLSDENLKELIMRYANEDMKVEPQMFVRKQNNLRDRLYAVKRKVLTGSRTRPMIGK
jgi:hypothetical protein